MFHLNLEFPAPSCISEVLLCTRYPSLISDGRVVTPFYRRCILLCVVGQVLSRQIAELGIYPAVDPLDSTSRMLDPRVIGDEHYETARATQKLLQDYKGLQVTCV